MAKTTQVLEEALRLVLGDSNLPTRYEDFQSLTRDLVRALAPHAVLVDRVTYTALIKRDAQVSKSLEETTARFKAHNDKVENGMRERGSIPPVSFTVQQLTALANRR